MAKLTRIQSYKLCSFLEANEKTIRSSDVGQVTALCNQALGFRVSEYSVRQSCKQLDIKLKRRPHKRGAQRKSRKASETKILAKALLATLSKAEIPIDAELIGGVAKIAGEELSPIKALPHNRVSNGKAVENGVV